MSRSPFDAPSSGHTDALFAGVSAGAPASGEETLGGGRNLDAVLRIRSRSRSCSARPRCRSPT